jgi:mono/diheme cytochrome c family protein
MRRAWFLMVSVMMALLAFLAPACGPGSGPSEEPAYELAVLLLPEGEPEAGKEAFRALGCIACHAVAWEEDLPAPTSATPGPELGVDPIQLGPGGVAASITAPSHKVPAPYQREGGSPMPDYTQIMTVRQLADIVTFLKRQGLETQAKSGGG